MFNIKEKDLKTGIMLLGLGGIIYFLIIIRVILLPFIVGIVIAYLFYPLIHFLRKRNIPKTWAIYILIMVFLILIILISFLIIPALLTELENLTTTIPEYVKEIDKYIDNLNKEYHRVNMPPIIKEVIDRTLKKSEEQVITFMENFTELIINSLSTLLSLVIAPFISYYILKDMDKLKRGIIRFLPRSKRRTFLEIGVEINKIFLGYLRGQIWISIIVGILISIGLVIFNIKFAILLGFVAGLSNMIPFIGPIISSIPAIFIALLSSPTKAISIGLLFLIIQQLESSIISPKIMSNEVGIHPLIVIFSLLAGAKLYGILGLLLAIPIAGSLIVIFKYIFRFLKDESIK